MLRGERRQTPRDSVQLPIVITDISNGDTVSGCTRDVSAGGVFFYVKDWLMELSTIQLAVSLPAEITGRDAVVHLTCDAIVMRVEKGQWGMRGVAVRIEQRHKLN